jgi:hypothetical protein
MEWERAGGEATCNHGNGLFDRVPRDGRGGCRPRRVSPSVVAGMAGQVTNFPWMDGFTFTLCRVVYSAIDRTCCLYWGLAWQKLLKFTA